VNRLEPRQPPVSILGCLASLGAALGLGILLYADVALLRGDLTPAAPPPQPPSRGNWAADFPARIDQVTRALVQIPIPLPTPREEPQGAGALRWQLRRYDLTLPAPDAPGSLAALFAPVHTAVPDATVTVAEEAGGARVQIGVDGLLTHVLAVHWLTRQPRVAIIIDDLGNDLRVAHDLGNLGAPLSFAVMPGRPFTKETTELAALLGQEVLVHLPMEAESGEDFGADNVLQVSASRDATVRAVDRALAAVPHAVGVNNHMGSRFTADAEHMRWVLERVKQAGLFFIDSRTTPHSVACEVAASLALACAERSVFLDDVDDEAAVRGQLQTLLAQARTHGDGIAIGHPRPATVAALRAVLPDFAAAGIEVVPLSAIVAPPSLSRR
jgi:polysaccharide deacetylase 2 family uncharacterized protein YibQ